MLPGLIAIARMIALVEQSRAALDTEDAYDRSRRLHPVRPSTETIDGMLYVGLRPATHHHAA